MKDIDSILASLPSLAEAELADAIDVLYYFVKEHEGEEQIKPIEKALPSLSKYLLYDGPHLIMECMLSIFRRVDINKDTIQEIMSLYMQTPDGNLISVLYSLNAEQFTREVQDFVISTFSEFPDEAIHVFCGNCLGTLTTRSLNELYTLLVKNVELRNSNQKASVEPKSILYVLCHQTHSQNYNQAIEMLLTILPKLDKELKLEVIKYLSFFSKNMGFPIFKITAIEKDIDIRLETVKSLERIISSNLPRAKRSDRTNQSIELLNQIAKDKNRKVADTAINALKNN